MSGSSSLGRIATRPACNLALSWMQEGENNELNWSSLNERESQGQQESCWSLRLMWLGMSGLSGQLCAALWPGNVQVHCMFAAAVTSGDFNNNN